MEQIKYSAEVFQLIKELTSLGNKLNFIKDDTSIIISKSTPDKSNGYILKCPKELFNFESMENLAFYDYNEFHNYFKVYDSPELYLDTEHNRIILTEDNSKIAYVLSDFDSFEEEEQKTFPKKINFGETVYSFKFTNQDHNELLHMISLIQRDKIKYTNVKISEGTINFNISNADHFNSFDKTFTLDKCDSNETLEYTIFSDIFTYMPNKKDYQIDIIKDGILTKISLLNQKVSLDMFTSKIRD